MQPRAGSLAEITRVQEEDRRALERLRSISRDKLSFIEDRTLYDLVERDLLSRIEQLRLRMYLTPFLVHPRVPPLLAGLIEKLQMKPAEVSREYIREQAALVREAIASRMLPARDMAQPAVRAFEIHLRRNATVRPEIRELCDLLSKEYLPACPQFLTLSSWPNGAEVYRELIRRAGGGLSDVKQIHGFGLAEVARLRAAMLESARETGHSGTLNEFLQSTATDGRSYFSSENALLGAYRALSAILRRRCLRW
jgi:uncharacterized protein (DUF885 family)